jgi:4-amino-4-deoxy-L-arabinose transferase-like glycosyltransferase
MRGLTRRSAIAAGLFLATFFLVAASSRDYGVTWDEPPYFIASDLHANWIRRLVKDGLRGEWREVVAEQNIQMAWHWNPYHVPHPPFSRIVSGLLKDLATPLLDDVSAYRLGPALFFAILVALMFQWMSELFGIASGLFSVLSLLLIPNLFGYAHFAVTDVPLATMWFATAYCFYKGISDLRWSITLGIVWGLAISTKFPALLALFPLVLWAHVFHRDKYANNMLAMLFMAPVIMITTQPYLWHQTAVRILEFLYEGLSRGYRVDTNFGVFFRNEVVYSHQLPWYYPPYLVGITTPEPILALALLGSSLIWKREYRASVSLLIANGAFILMLGAMPGAVLHDGIRQILGSLPFIAALAGVGLLTLVNRAESFARSKLSCFLITNLRLKIYVALFLTLGFSPALDVYLTHPYQLAFYNRLVGGIPGAYEKGLETTYFLEVLTPDLLSDLNQKLPLNSAVHASFANPMLTYYQDRGELRHDLRIVTRPPYDYLLLLNRRSALSSHERRLIDSVPQPYISLRLAGVSLVSVFDLKSYRHDSLKP